MFFIALLILITISIASSAAFFSVYGLASIFSGSFWPIVAMAASLEAGKLIAASYTYRYWKQLSILMRSYLISAIIILMIITSAGIYGFLAKSYQSEVLPYKQNEQRILLLEQDKVEIEKLKEERLERKRQIDEQIANLPDNSITGRQRLVKTFESENKQITSDVAKYTDLIREKTLEIQKLKETKLMQTAEVGPIIFIADNLGKNVDDATKYLIFLIIFAFDPLAVILTIGINIALIERQRIPAPVDFITQPEVKSVINNDVGVEQIISGVDAIREKIEELNAKSKLTPEQEEEKKALEKIVRRGEIDRKIRAGKKEDVNAQKQTLD
jgi:hypothetical protein